MNYDIIIIMLNWQKLLTTRLQSSIFAQTVETAELIINTTFYKINITANGDASDVVWVNSSQNPSLNHCRADHKNWPSSPFT